MFRVFSKTLFVLMLSICGFFIAYHAEAKAKVKLSKKYIPPGNPGGANFYADEDFAESYKLYEKRRKLLKKKKLQDKTNANITKEKLINKLKEKRIVTFDDQSSYGEACIIDDEENTMVNQHGINIARLKGAVFIDDPYQEPVFQHEDKQQVGGKFTSTQEKKISPINVIIKETPSKRMVCSHDSIANLNIDNNNTQYSLSGSDSFESVVDTTK